MNAVLVIARLCLQHDLEYCYFFSRFLYRCINKCSNQLLKKTLKDEHLFVKTNNIALCLNCKENMSVLKDYHLRRHYLQKLQPNLVHIKECKDKIVELKNVCHVNKIKTQTDSVTNVSYVVANLIAKNSKSFTDGD